MSAFILMLGVIEGKTRTECIVEAEVLAEKLGVYVAFEDARHKIGWIRVSPTGEAMQTQNPNNLGDGEKLHKLFNTPAPIWVAEYLRNAERQRDEARAEEKEKRIMRIGALRFKAQEMEAKHDAAHDEVSKLDRQLIAIYEELAKLEGEL